MKKFFKFISSRLFLIVFSILIDVIILIGIFVLLGLIINKYFSSYDYYETNRIILQIVLPIVYVLFELFTIGIVVYIINSKGADSYKIAWLVVVVILPIIGPLLYLGCANKKFSIKDVKLSKRVIKTLKKSIDKNVLINLGKDNLDAIRMSQYILNTTGAAIYDNTEVTYFKSGEEAFEKITTQLKKAKHYIFLEYFIISKGYVWDKILEILIQKVNEGVDVKIIYDDVGSISTFPRNYYKTLNKYGIEAYPFNKFNPFHTIKANNRDHRKILVIDGLVSFTGGINLADEYINKIDRLGHWKDNAIMIKGNATFAFTMLFLSTWLILIKKNKDIDINFEDYSPYKFYDKETLNIDNDGFVQPYGDVPYTYENVSESIYLHLIQRANKYCYITTPYLIIDDNILNSLISASKQGVDVRILLPHIPDKKIVFDLSRSYYKRLINAGVKIYEYIPGFIHSKMFIVDDIFATVGTVNLDYRSLYLHMECGTFMYKCSSINDMKKDFLSSLKVSKEITKIEYNKLSKGRRLYWAILRLFAPLL